MCNIVKEIQNISLQLSGGNRRSFNYNNIPSLDWVVKNQTGNLLHDLCKEIGGRRGLDKLQVGWATLDMVIAICSPHLYHPSVCFKMESFDIIYQYYESAFKDEHYAVDCAVSSRNLQLVNYLVNIHNVPFTTRSIDTASLNGDLDIIKLLINNNTNQNTKIKFTNHSYDNASMNGHLDVLIYFDGLREIGTTTYRVDFTVAAIDGAAKNKHYHVIEHILTKYENDKEMDGCLFTERALVECAANNNIDMLERLLEFSKHHHQLDAIAKGGKWAIDAVTIAAEQGHLNMVKHLFERPGLLYGVPPQTLLSAIRGNHIDTIKYLDQTSEPIPIPIPNPTVDMYKYLYEKYPNASKEKYHWLLQQVCSLTDDSLKRMNLIKTIVNDNNGIIGSSLCEIPNLLELSSHNVEMIKYWIQEKNIQPSQDDIGMILLLHGANTEFVKELLVYLKHFNVSFNTIPNLCSRGLVDTLEVIFTNSTSVLQQLDLEQSKECLIDAISSGSLETVKMVIKHLPQLHKLDHTTHTDILSEIVLPPIGECHLDVFKYLVEDRFKFILDEGYIYTSKTTALEQILHLAEMIHRHCPLVKAINPLVLLTHGNIRFYLKVLKWNREIDEQSLQERQWMEKVEKKPKLDIRWYLRLVEKGNIALADYYTANSIVTVPTNTAIHPKCQRPHIKTIKYIQTLAQQAAANNNITILRHLVTSFKMTLATPQIQQLKSEGGSAMANEP
ncbi:hypothetical protein DFA_04212 [Cavenderia fasciculata]|uniref:Ankyrin repeat-containing protein n=1 Tax=Cavenderia fasciculata TaxID=261658 RepID=F4Q1L5_CACFS|nr:uncharacterized protein DFA_04212 [Cavenderia fasciculata]EGG18716.1 hypothetical protein DFA_04212 [Cavenderia fasciculata]|eukprot:XP_004366620.1 hypothetical protein DFA_04212 [Cavenderia fasciculata]